MEYISDSSSDSESDHEEIQDDTDIQDFPELSLVDDLRTSLRITECEGWYSSSLNVHFVLCRNCKTYINVMFR